MDIWFNELNSWWQKKQDFQAVCERKPMRFLFLGEFIQ